jgi:hypothetical protein
MRMKRFKVGGLDRPADQYLDQLLKVIQTVSKIYVLVISRRVYICLWETVLKCRAGPSLRLSADFAFKQCADFCMPAESPSVCQFQALENEGRTQSQTGWLWECFYHVETSVRSTDMWCGYHTCRRLCGIHLQVFLVRFI